MKITNGKCNVSTVKLTSVKFGSIIQLVSKPAEWPQYSNWDAEDLFILTREYYRGSRTKRISTDEHLLAVSLSTGHGVPLSARLDVIVREDVVACVEPS